MAHFLVKMRPTLHGTFAIFFLNGQNDLVKE